MTLNRKTKKRATSLKKKKTAARSHKEGFWKRVWSRYSS